MDKKQFGAKLKILILESGLEAQDLAKQINCHVDSIFKWMRGVSYPSPKYHKIIESALTCRIIVNFELYREGEEKVKMSDFEREAIKWKSKFELLSVLYEQETGKKVPLTARVMKK